MKILYIAPRYHTNQVPVMHGWKVNGDTVFFMAQFCGVTEVHDDVQFHQMEQSNLSKWLYKQIEKKYPADIAETKKILAFIPKQKDIKKVLNLFQPDMIIMRERTVCNAVAYHVCKKMGYKNVILYVQTPIYGLSKKSSRLHSWLKNCFFPRKVFSPVWYKGQERGKTNYLGGEFKQYVPLVCDRPAFKERVYCADGMIHILDAGKFRDYKNHFGFVESVHRVHDKSRLKITIAGQVTTEPEKLYFHRLQEQIKKYELENVIELKQNVPFKEMNQLYAKNDVLVLPSKGESAGMVILEAMSQGLCVLSSIHCGLASVLDEYKCGFTFDIEDSNALAIQLDKITANPDIIKKMGEKSVDVICRNFLFENYKTELFKMIGSENEGGNTKNE